jgi:hypothetical protein
MDTKKRNEDNAANLRRARARNRELYHIQYWRARFYDDCRAVGAGIFGNEFHLGGNEHQEKYKCRAIPEEGEGPDHRPADWKPEVAEELEMTMEELKARADANVRSREAVHAELRAQREEEAKKEAALAAAIEGAK